MERFVNKRLFATVLAFSLIVVLFPGCTVLRSHKQQATFKNPILPSGADPWNIYKDGFYYYTHTMGDSIVIWKTKDLTQLRTAEKKTIWIPPKGKPYSRQLWAPEM